MKIGKAEWFFWFCRGAGTISVLLSAVFFAMAVNQQVGWYGFAATLLAAVIFFYLESSSPHYRPLYQIRKK